MMSARPRARSRVATALGVGLTLAATVMPAVPEDRKPVPSLAGSLPVPALWTAWKAKFLAPEGRVIDDANGGVSHSEGQGYGLLLAVAAGDREAFAAMWAWTRANLALRKDGLASWRWQPGPAPNVRDPNNATDGDILIAWALAEAADAWGEPAHAAAARRIARAVFAQTVIKTRFGATLLPGASGFGAADRKDGPVVNPSYWVFPAFARLEALTPDLDWRGLSANGDKILGEARFGPAGLPPEWLSLAGDTLRPADGFAPSFGYNAVRIPLYLAWSDGFRRERLAPFMARWTPPGGAASRPMAVVDLTSGHDLEPLVDRGYRAIAGVVACAMEGTRFPDDLRGPEVDHYYPTTLRALALIAVNQRHPTCW